MEAAIQVSIFFFFLRSFISNTQTMESSPLSVDKMDSKSVVFIAIETHFLSHYAVYTHNDSTPCMYMYPEKLQGGDIGMV